jgi:hypothetical protein
VLLFSLKRGKPASMRGLIDNDTEVLFFDFFFEEMCNGFGFNKCSVAFFQLFRFGSGERFWTYDHGGPPPFLSFNITAKKRF